MSAPVRVVVVDDQALVRGAFCVLVGSAPDLEVVGEGENGAEPVPGARARGTGRQGMEKKNSGV